MMWSKRVPLVLAAVAITPVVLFAAFWTLCLGALGLLWVADLVGLA